MKTYTTAEFAKKAHVSVRTIRYYDDIGLVKPSNHDANGCRCYTEEDFFHLQKVLSLKYFGFSLKEIEALTCDKSSNEIKELFDMQIKLVQKQIDNLKQVESGLVNASKILESQGALRWEDVIHLIYLMDMEEQLVEQYQNSENVEVRIKLHSQFSANKQGWFAWLLSHIDVEHSERILEIGCGNGELWKAVNCDTVSGKEIVLSDISAGMIRDAMSNLKRLDFRYEVFDCSEIPYEACQFDSLIANHMLFYVKNIPGVLNEICRVLRPSGAFYCSTYGEKHMKEISELVHEFDKRINLSEIELYKIFGLENGQEILEEHFDEVSLQLYDDYLEVDDAKLLCDYIYSCHGNQNTILHGRKDEFKKFIEEKMKEQKIRITKQAGMFICKKPKYKA